MNKKLLLLHKKFLLFIFFMLLSIVSSGQTTLFQFNFETATTPNINNTVGTPIIAQFGLENLQYANYNSCGTGMSSSLAANGWNINDYYRIAVNTTGFTNMTFSYCNSTNNTNINSFDIRYSIDNGATISTVAPAYVPTTGGGINSAVLPAATNNRSVVWIYIYKSNNNPNINTFLIVDNITLTGFSIPSISNFTPNTACAASGSSVVITGTNFTGATAVNFNGIPASSYTVNSNTQITAQLPATATTGAITVTTPGGTATSTSSFTVSLGISENNLNYTNGTSGQVSVTATENANAVFNAPVGTYFSTVNFASYGTPNGAAPDFVLGNCNALTSQSVTESYLLGNNNRAIPATNGVFTDPCSGTPKRLYVVASYVQPICNGSVVSITGSIPSGGSGTYSYQWQSSTSSATSGFAAAAGINNETNYVSGTLAQNTWFRRVVTSGGCSSTSAVIQINLNSTPVGGTVTGGMTICSGSTSGMMTLEGYTGTITKWQSSVSPFSTWTDIVNTSATYTSGVLNATTQFRAVVQSGSCAFVNSAVTTITVNSTPTITPNKVDETCSTANNGSIFPTLSGGLTNIRYIKLTQKYNVDAYQQVAEIQALEVFTGTNVALSSLGSVATGSSVWQNSSGPNYIPSNINNGVITGNTFWHSASSNINEWVQIDLRSGKNLDNIRIYNRTDCCSQRGQNMLLELFDSSDNLIYSKTIDLYQSGANVVDVNILDLSWTDGATTLNRTGLDSATYILNYADAIGCSLSSPINIGTANIAAPTRGTITPVTCNVPIASVILNNLPSAGTWTLMQSGTSTATITGTGISATVSGLAPGTYTFSVSIDGCSASNPVVVKIDSLQETVWNGAWSNGLPNSDKKLIFNANYSQTTDLVACSCEVTLGNVIVRSDKTLTLTNELKVSGGTLTFENNASLVQINEDPTINSGNITYQRETVTAVDKFDYTYWSSPVSSQTLYNTSPNTLWDKYMSFDAVNNNWKQENSSKVMERGVGYIIRGPQNHYAPNPIGTYRANFIGVPHNGTIPVAITATGEASYLLGNPYPSALDADLFLQVNEDVLDGTLYFWTHNTDIAPSGSNYIYDSDDYASYNLLGGVGTAAASDVNPIPTIPSGEIASGQGFFATSIVPGTVNFTNTMRLIGNVNSQFFRSNSKSKKNASFDKNRLWLNFSNKEGAFKQTLIGYVTGATNEYERTFDGISFDGNTFVDFYSVFEDKNFVIQGRALPFLQSDQVPLGYKTTIAGAFTITIFQTDGFLTTQNVFLEDKMLGIIHNLKESPYNFTTEKGVFNERFVLRYNDKTLGTGDFESQEKTIVVFKEKNELKIKSEFETMKRVIVFDLLGKKVFEETLEDVNEFRTSNITLKNQIVIVKVVLTNGQVVAKKVSY
ncbi:IPT/TIG domain-containing protein [Flavobacterium limicola]|uniref:IPT/TIG domain-containing protein n=1 Tax=Flavobacterium limicola TaxID=180441 RepID=A0A495S6A7_9FLAO|nr:T9SS sorting signal type C domain-containing protein [Flavobacterium limicola]RKS94668.1 IPT/TIG domain-containing protein [Flavobacterium limicola]